MNRRQTISRIAIDPKERTVLERLPASTLAKVVDVKKIFGKDSRVTEHKPAPEPQQPELPADWEERCTFTDEEIRQAEIEERAPEKLTDLGNGRRFEAIHSGNVLYSKQRNKWVLWTGDGWQWDETGEVFDRATVVIQSIYGEAAEHPDKEMREALSAHAVKSESRGKIDNMLALAEKLPGVRTDLERFDRNPNAFGCLNSTINLLTGKNERPKREDYITLKSPVRFDPDAMCPRWLQFIDEITLGDIGLARFLQRAVGYSMTGDTSEQCFFLLFGTGGNGKSTFIDTVMTMLGDYAGQVKTEVLLESRFEQKDYHLAELSGKRFVGACESDMSRKLATGLLKQATGGEPIPARRPFEKPFSFKPQFKLWLSTNARPRVDDPSDAMWRRIHAIPFNAKFIKQEDAPEGYAGLLVDGDLPDRLGAEMPGILKWGVEGCLEWQRKGLSPPAIVKDATSQYREEEDTLGNFIAECCEVGPHESLPFSDLYASYASWCMDSSEDVENKKTFAAMLSGRGFAPDRHYSEGRIRRGLKLRGKNNEDR